MTELSAIVIGLASDHAWSMADGLLSTGKVAIDAVVDGGEHRRAHAQKLLGPVTEYRSLADVPDDARFDIALVCSDNRAKADVVPWCLARGSHVYMDKPLAATGEGAAAIAAAGGTGRVMVAFHTVFDGVHDEAKQLIADGALGRVYLARGVAGHGGLREGGVSDDFVDWLVDPDRGGGGTFIDQACYLLDTFMDQLGDTIVEVDGVAVNLGERDYLPAAVEDVSLATLRFAGGALGVIDTKWHQIGPSPLRLSYHGTRGTLIDYGGRWELHTAAGVVPPPAWQRTGEHGGVVSYARTTPPKDGYSGEAGYFVARVLSGEPFHPALTVTAALRVQRVIDAFYASARSGARVAVTG
ncbi:Gfo/Idh/MocA family protein [Jiangella sp. DSM 45060]|uniref:Gfo/Idh/MocA family protein n=1 Tax=Jiangella sp. DSM 45060 TaxID=1798224 RepID=UPI00087BA207|nr:Gfo/Idh/MocA family oxidoreductase [Jiangella sp. DSM 45060]SDS45022.1 Predicted dehydrogenase [Jiangella sp. DSM 45060]